MIDPFINGLTNAFLLVIMLFGLFGMIVPIFPGGFVIWLATLLYGLLSGGLEGWGLVLFFVITAFMIAGIIVDDILMAAAARKAGASWWSLFYSFVGGVVGTFMLPPFGGILGAPLLLYVSEYLRGRSREKAWKITSSLLIGWGWSFVARFGLGVLMIGVWFAWVYVTPS
jgi:uncharacterized protein YqgC (DUF456 family)